MTVLELCIEPKDQFLSGGSCRVVNRALGVLRVWDPSLLCIPSGPIPSLSLSLRICTRKELDDGLQGSLTRNFPSRFSLRNRFSCETLGQAQGQPAVVLALSHYRTNYPGTQRSSSTDDLTVPLTQGSRSLQSSSWPGLNLEGNHFQARSWKNPLPPGVWD